jgi:chemotaxis family two-component system response regulator PixG
VRCNLSQDYPSKDKALPCREVGIFNKMLTPSSVSSIQSPVTRQEVALTPNELVEKIQACSQDQFTGQLDLSIEYAKDHHWSLFFCLGDLIGCTGGVHPIRRWFRQLSQHCPQLPVYIVTPGSKQPQCLDYDSLATLVRQGEVPLRQMAEIVTGNVTEILFDIIQREEQLHHRSGVQLSYRPIPMRTIDANVVSIRVHPVCLPAMQNWEAWQQAGLADYSPNLAPKIRNAEELQWQTSQAVYRNLSALLDGNQTLRDLAVKLKQNLLPLTQSLMPHIQKGLIVLEEVKDFPSYSIKPATATNSLFAPAATPVSPVRPQSAAAAIAYIDDSRLDSQAMGHILTQAGYRFINIQDPVKALPVLLEHKPNLIFLDLVMPIANGYEICAQIRRISAFKDTPVIILTSNDGIVDRVRAKLVGSSGFLAKPINSEKVLTTLQRYLPTSTNAQFPR